MKEIEAKFRVHPPFELPPLVGGGSPVVTVAGPDEQRLEARYFDTADLRLARQGVTLRYRTGEGTDGWDLKVPFGRRDDGVRDEVHVAARSATPPPELLRTVSAYLRGEAVRPVASLVTGRLLHRLLDAEGATLAELVDDTVEVVDGDVVAARFREIEVEDKGGGSAVLAAMSKRLRAAGAVQGRFEPKLVRALGPLATAPADPPPPATPKGKPTVRDVVTAYLRTHVRALLDADVAVRLGNPEGVHDVRVAARRLRSTLRTFSAVFVPETAAQLAGELAWFADSFGDARDAEVLIARLRTFVETLPEADRGGPAALLDRWAAEAAKHAESREALDSERYAALLSDLAVLATAPPFAGETDAAATKGLPKLLRPVLRAFRSRMVAATAAGSVAEDYHRARIAGKRLRYAVEVAAPVFGKNAKRYADALAVLQEELGAQHDAFVALDTITTRAHARGVKAADAFALGVLHAGQTRALADACGRVHKAWSRERDQLTVKRLVDGD